MLTRGSKFVEPRPNARTAHRAIAPRCRMHMATRHRSLSHARRAFWGILDHGLFSITNFALSIVLARWLPATDYGAFAIAFSVFLLIAALQIGTIIEPMLIFGSGRYGRCFPAYVRTVTRAHFVVMACCSVLLLVMASALAAVGNAAVAMAFVGLAIATPFFLFASVRRRVFYVDGRVHFAALTSAILLITSFAAMYGLMRANRLSAFSGFIAIGAAGALSAALSVFLEETRDESSQDAPSLAEMAKEHWRYARWGTPAIAMSWVLVNAFVVGVPILTDVQAAAGLRAMLNLIQPPIQLLNALGTVMLPSLVRAGNSERFRKIARSSLLVFVIVALAYVVPVVMFAKSIAALLYHSRYTGMTGLIDYLIPVPVLCAVITACVIVLQAREKPRPVFVSWATGALGAVIVGIPLIVHFGVRGAAAAISISYCAASLAFCYLAFGELRREPKLTVRGIALVGDVGSSQ